MTPEEVTQLIQQLSYADPRILPEDPGELRGKTAMWSAVLRDVPYDFALNTAVDHYRTSPFPIAPAEIAAPWAAQVKARLASHTDPTPAADPDNWQAYRDELIGTRYAVATGQIPPATHELTAGPPHPDVADRIAGFGRYIPDEVRRELAPYRPAAAAYEAAITAGQPDYLAVRCPWCDAPEGERCRSRRVIPGGGATSNRPRTEPHPSRIEEARYQLEDEEIA